MQSHITAFQDGCISIPGKQILCLFQNCQIWPSIYFTGTRNEYEVKVGLLIVSQTYPSSYGRTGVCQRRFSTTVPRGRSGLGVVVAFEPPKRVRDISPLRSFTFHAKYYGHCAPSNATISVCEATHHPPSALLPNNSNGAKSCNIISIHHISH